MTNGWIDIKNTDMMLIMGGNPAENHPCGFKWPIEAKRQRNAKMIVVDPRFTRTAAVADLFLQIRAGADIAFLGGLIRYAIENGRIAHDYLLHYTNAAFLIQDGFKLPEDGLFSGFDAATAIYDRSTWNYEEPKPGEAAYDLSLQHPRSVFQLLKQHYSRYTPEMVERITGIPKEQFLKAADLFTSIRKDGDMKKAGTIIYAVGWTQHSFGTQIIRTAAILQLLLGNVGRAGGGVNALRGHSNIQGATDMAGIFDLLPGYLKMPAAADTDFKAYTDRITPKAAKPGPWESMNYWSNTPKFAVSLLKALYGDAAQQGERLGLPLPAEDRAQALLDRNLGRHVPRHHQGPVRLRHERRRHRSQLAEEYRRAEEGRLAGGLRNLSRRNQRVLEIARHHHRGDEAHSDHGLPPARRGLRGEGRHLRQLGALAAMEERRAAAARRWRSSIRKFWRASS